MKYTKLASLLIISCCIAALFANNTNKEEKEITINQEELKKAYDNASYMLSFNQMEDMKKQDKSIVDIASIKQGFIDQQAAKESSLKDFNLEETRKFLDNFAKNNTDFATRTIPQEKITEEYTRKIKEFFYFSGYNLSKSADSIKDKDFNKKQYLKGVSDSLNNKKAPEISEELRTKYDKLIRKDIEQKQKKQIAAMQAKKDALKVEKAQKIKDFLAKDNLKKTESGLIYSFEKTTQEGKKPTIENSVIAHYEGLLEDGTIFDSSYLREEPATFPLAGVIKGWTEILQLMKEGETLTVKIPSNLAYGERGAGNAIPPNTDLFFTIELIEVK